MTTLEQLNARLTEAEAAHKAASKLFSALQAEKRQIDSMIAGVSPASSADEIITARKRIKELPDQLFEAEAQVREAELKEFEIRLEIANEEYRLISEETNLRVPDLDAKIIETKALLETIERERTGIISRSHQVSTNIHFAQRQVIDAKSNLQAFLRKAAA